MLIYCAECEHACSDQAERCTRCGHQLAAPPPPRAAKIKRTLSRKSKSIIALCNLAAAVVIAVTYYAVNRPARVQSSPIQAERAGLPVAGLEAALREGEWMTPSEELGSAPPGQYIMQHVTVHGFFVTIAYAGPQNASTVGYVLPDSSTNTAIESTMMISGTARGISMVSPWSYKEIVAWIGANATKCLSQGTSFVEQRDGYKLMMRRIIEDGLPLLLVSVHR